MADNNIKDHIAKVRAQISGEAPATVVETTTEAPAPQEEVVVEEQPIAEAEAEAPTED